MSFKITTVVLIGVAVITTYIAFRYSSWESKTLDELRSTGSVANLATGTMEYSLVGRDDEPVLLYLHGSPGGFDHAVVREGYRVLTPSRPGYLKTPLSVGTSPEAQAKAYKQLLDFLGIDTVAVTGASGGGPSAIAFAALYPDQTNQLVLIEAVSGSISLPNVPSIVESDFSFWLVMGAMEKALGAAGLAKRFIPDDANSQRVISNPAKLTQFSKALWSAWPYSQRREGWENDRDQYLDLDLPAEEISAPTLIVHGSEDASVPVEQSKTLASRIPGARLEIIDGADHMMPFSHREELEEAISRFSASIGR